MSNISERLKRVLSHDIDREPWTALTPLNDAILNAIEALELSACLCHDKWTEQGDVFTKCNNCKALNKLDKALKEAKP